MLIVRVEILIQDDYVVVSFLDRSGKEDLIFCNSTPFALLVHQKKLKGTWNTKVESDS